MLVTIIIPVYNTEKYLEHCLLSVCSQTYKNIEIIIINDASTDGSLDIINRYKEKDDRIILVNQPDNCGNGKGRNLGIRMAHGEYIMFVDSDDSIVPDAVEKLVRKVTLKRSQVVVLGYNFVRIEKNNKREVCKEMLPRITKSETHDELFKCLLLQQKNLSIPAWNYFVCRSYLLENDVFFDESGRHFEDVIYATRLFYHLKSVDSIVEPLYDYVIRIGSITHKWTRSTIQDRILASLQVKEFLKEEGSYEDYKDAFTFFFVNTAFLMPFIDFLRMPKLDKDVYQFLYEFSQQPAIRNFHCVKLDLPIQTDDNGIRESQYETVRTTVEFVSHHFKFAVRYYRFKGFLLGIVRSKVKR